MKKLYVGNISYQTSEETLKGAFASYPSVTSVKIITDKFSGQSRGFGFVEFSDDAEAMQAVEDINGIELEGKNLSVNEARPQGSGNNRRRSGGYRGGRGNAERGGNDRGGYRGGNRSGYGDRRRSNNGNAQN